MDKKYIKELEKLVAEQTAELEENKLKLAVEAASQRVRKAAMSMVEPDDIMDVLHIVREQVTAFELNNIANWIWLVDEEGMVTSWDITEAIVGKDAHLINSHFDPKAYSFAEKVYLSWEKQDGFISYEFKGEALVKLANQIDQLNEENGKLMHAAIDQGIFDDGLHVRGYTFKHGILGLDFDAEPPKKSEVLLENLSKALELAYQRFHDLKKAELQAYEAKIETSLEKIRSRTSAMHNSEELGEIAVLIGQELRKLNFPMLFETGYVEWLENEDKVQGWLSDFEGQNMEPFQLPRRGDWVMNERDDSYKDQKVLLHQEVGGQELIDHIAFALPSVTSAHVRKQVDEFFSDPTHFYHSFFPDGALNIISQEKLNRDQEDLFIRFAQVFRQSFARFKDLQKAEKQAYESRVEASLERVRSQAAAMNHSDDLEQIAEGMFREMEILKINPLRYGLAMIDGETKEANLWASTVDDGRYLDKLGQISLTIHPMLQKAYDIWESQHEELIYELKGKERADYYKIIGKIVPDIPNLDRLQDPKYDSVQNACFFTFKTGALYAFTEGKPSEEGISVLKRFANVFEQAHIRYEDLQVAERQSVLIRKEKERLEKALIELQETQEQLVQQEKLASLGQLTAGIAHEIKNPLNFVNNFSALSVELLEEVKEELDKNPPDIEEALDILSSVHMNLTKINEHGTRADSIVKSMLQHSRGSSGKMEDTDVNKLIDEFVNLAYHGMRAGKDSIDVNLEVDLDENLGSIPLIAEDFSRVILNICKNAFDAMQQKKKEANSEYRPVLKVTTSSTKEGKIISVEDNGPGIPEDHRDKILQPFFTTKKGKEGTGLGLSITNDILKAHGAKLNIESEEGEYSRFIISFQK